MVTRNELLINIDKIANTDGPLKKSDPFFQIRHKPPTFTKEITLHRSNVNKSTSTPKFNPFELSVAQIGGMDEEFTISMFGMFFSIFIYFYLFLFIKL